jgi:hypothetical protein
MGHRAFSIMSQLPVGVVWMFSLAHTLQCLTGLERFIQFTVYTPYHHHHHHHHNEETCSPQPGLFLRTSLDPRYAPLLLLAVGGAFSIYVESQRRRSATVQAVPEGYLQLEPMSDMA